MNVSSLILVIDDDRSLLMGVSEILKRGGYEVITATNGTDGIQMALESSPDLIISDMMMPPPRRLRGFANSFRTQFHC